MTYCALALITTVHCWRGLYFWLLLRECYDDTTQTIFVSVEKRYIAITVDIL